MDYLVPVLEHFGLDNGTRCGEAENILLPLCRANPTVHGDQMARIWCLRAVIGEMLDQSGEELCRLARRAVAAAYDPKVKHTAQGLVEKYCK